MHGRKSRRYSKELTRRIPSPPSTHLSGLLSWYRDVIDEELIAAWKKVGRANLTTLVQSLADSRVASGIIEFSWREQRQSAFSPAYAAMFTNLMTRFPESGKPFVDDIQQRRRTFTTRGGGGLQDSA